MELTHFGHLARVLHWLTDQAITARLEEMELTASQGRVMGYLAHCNEPPCPRDLEEEFRLSHPTVSGLLTRLEKKGFLELRSDPADRRCKRIVVTEKGMGFNQAIHDTILTMEEQMVRDFTESEKEQFSQLFSRAITNMGGCTEPPSCKEEPKQ